MKNVSDVSACRRRVYRRKSYNDIKFHYDIHKSIREDEEESMNFIKFLDENFEKYICMVLISAMTVLIAVQVFMRYVMNNSLSWSEELARYIFIWLIYLGISYGAMIMRHIKIEAALYLYPKKLRPYIVILGDTLFCCFALYISYASYTNVVRINAMHQLSPGLGLPMSYVYAAPMVGFALTAFRQVQTICFRFKNLKQDEKEEPQW
ncbi:MAG: TRAP transporter small permease [Methylobacteriaceae bacterium]|nr:TRAP transporter small permease [Methylobacteriaceae bacterium]